MEKSSKRGKIPQQDWPSIIARYEAGETLASIARTYDCSPPAISYIVSRTRARGAMPESAAQAHNISSSGEPQLIKGAASELPANVIPADETPHSRATIGETRALDVPAVEPRLIERPPSAPQHTERQLLPDRQPPLLTVRESPLSHDGHGPAQRNGQEPHDASPAETGSAARSLGTPSGSSQNGEPRRRLHLSLPHGNDDQHAAESSPQGAAHSGFGPGAHPTQRAPGGQQIPSQTLRPSPVAAPAGPPLSPGFTEPHRGKEGAAFIDQALRERVDGDIAAFLMAFDAALDHDTAESRTGLREATDRLLRAGARTRIELERLEARVPLPPRDKVSQTTPAFRR
jgi:hypothetical protein